MSPEYYLFRHGQTFATQGNRGYGLRVFSAPILESGMPALQRMGEYLKDIPTDYQVSSAVKRCVQTTDIISKATGRPFIKDKRLNEYFLETFGYFVGRITRVLQDIETNKYKKVAICTHGAGLAVLINTLTKKKVQPSDLLTFPDPGRLIIIREGQLQEINFNT